MRGEVFKMERKVGSRETCGNESGEGKIDGKEGAAKRRRGRENWS